MTIIKNIKDYGKRIIDAVIHMDVYALGTEEAGREVIKKIKSINGD